MLLIKDESKVSQIRRTRRQQLVTIKSESAWIVNACKRRIQKITNKIIKLEDANHNLEYLVPNKPLIDQNIVQ